MDLKQKTISAGFWVGSANAVSRIVSFLTTLILAKLLIPDDFGIVAIGTLVVMTFGLFREMGINRALIYQRDNIQEAANTGFLLILGVSSLLYGLAFFLAPFLASFFNDLRIIAVIRVLSLGIVISAFSEIHSALLEKEILFKKTAIPEAVFFAVYGLTSVALAYFGFSYWSMVIGNLVADIAKILCFWMISDWRPKVAFNKDVARQLTGYGKHILGTVVVHFGIRNIDDAFVGRMLSKSTLGAYYLAYRIANFPATNITNVVGKIMFPVYLKLPNQAFDLRNAFLKTLRLTSTLSIPAALFIFFYVSDFLTLLYQDKWLEAVIPIQILSIYGLLRSLGSPMGGIFLATGRPDIPFKISLVQLIFLGLTLYPAITLFGIIGVCVISDIGMFISVCLHYVRLEKIIKSSPREVYRNISPFVLYSLISIAVPSLISSIIFTKLSIYSFCFKVAASIGIYVLFIMLFSKEIFEIFKISVQKMGGQEVLFTDDLSRSKTAFQ